MATTKTETPRVWIGCLASYNAGRLIGEWVDAVDVDEMQECWERVKVLAVAAAREVGEYPVYFGPPEEPFLADYDGFGNGLSSHFGEYADWAQVAAAGQAIEEHGDDVVAWALDNSVPFDEIDQHVRGEHESEEEYAQELVEEIGWSNVSAQLYHDGYGGHDQSNQINVFEELSSYLDWESIARELFRHGNYTSLPRGGRVLVLEDEV